MERVGVSKMTINLTKIFTDNAKAKVRILEHTTDIFSISNGLK